jgi:tetratricopeptide (TPR) repeat protein
MSRDHVRWSVRIVLVLLVIGGVVFLVRMYQTRQPAYLAKRAQQALEAGDDEKAEILLQNLVRRAPENTDAKLALADLFVRQAQRAGRPASYAADARAMQLLSDVASQRPDDLALQGKLLTAHLDSGRKAAATTLARSMVRAGSDNPTALYLVAWNAVSTGNHAAAREPLARLAEFEFPPRFRTLLLHAQLDRVAGDPQRLAKRLEQMGRQAAAMTPQDLVALDASDRRALDALLTFSVQQAQGPAEAQASAKQVLTIVERLAAAEDSDKAKVVLANQAATVLALLEEAHPLQPPVDPILAEGRRQLTARFDQLARPLIDAPGLSPLVFYLLAEAAFARGENALGMTTVRDGLARGAKLAGVESRELLRLDLLAARQLMIQGRIAEAGPHLERLLKDDTAAAWGHLLSGELALNEGRLEDAARHFQVAHPRFAGSSFVPAAMAGICLRLRRFDQAVPLLKAVIGRRDNMNQEERAWVQRQLTRPEQLELFLGLSYLALKQYDEVPALVEDLRSRGAEPAAVYLLASYHTERGEPQEAAQCLQEGRRKHPSNLGLLLEEIKALRAQSKDAQAEARLQQFVKDNPKHVAAQLLLAQWQVAQGQYDAALEVAAELAKRYPRAAVPQVLRADILLAAGRLEQALAAIEELRTKQIPREAMAVLEARAALMSHRLDDAAAALSQVSEGAQRSGLFRLWQGEVAYAQGDFQRAADDFSESFQVSALRGFARPKLLQALAELLQQNNPAAAEAKVNELLKKFPNESYLLVAGGELALRQGQFERALLLLDRAESVQPNSAAVIYAKARAWFHQGRLSRALTEVERALRTDPRHQPSLLLAAQVRLARNELPAALALTEQMLAAKPDGTEASLLRAEILRVLKRPGDAARSLEQLIERQPGVVAAYRLLAEIHQPQDADKALEVLRLGLKQVPNHPLLRHLEMSILCREGRGAEAEQAAAALAGEKPDADTCLAIGLTFQQANEFDAARRWAQRAMKLGDQSRQSAAHLLLGNVSLSEGRQKKDKQLLARARDHYAEVLKTQPENLLAANNLAWLLAEEFGEPEAARDVVNRILAKTSAKQLPATVADTFAMVYRKTGQLDGAQQLVEEVLRRSPDDSQMNFQAGLIYSQRQRPDAARKALHKAISLGLPAQQAAEAEEALRRLEPAPDEQAAPPAKPAGRESARQ